MSWDRLATTPELVVYEDSHGNPRLRSTITGRFLPMSYVPDYNRGPYGGTIDLALSLE